MEFFFPSSYFFQPKLRTTIATPVRSVELELFQVTDQEIFSTLFAAAC